MHFYYLILRLSFLYLICFQDLYGQQEILYLQHLSTKEGLTANTYTDILRRDSRHFIWVSSINGLNRYDGNEVMQFLPDRTDPHQLFDPLVQSAFFEDSVGRVWFNTSQKIHTYIPGKENFNQIFIQDRQGIEVHDFHIIHYDSLENNLWALVMRDTLKRFYDLLLLDADHPESNYQHIDKLPNYYHEGVHVEEGEYPGQYYLIQPRERGWEVRFYELGEKPKTKLFKNNKANAFKGFSFHHDAKKKLWVGTNQGLIQTDLEGQSFQISSTFLGDSVKGIRGIVHYDDQHLLIGTENQGLLLFNKDTYKYVQQVHTMQAGFVMPLKSVIKSMYLDKDHTVWISTVSEGVFYSNLKKKRFKSYLQKDLSGKQYNIKSLTEGPEGNIWSLTNNALIITNREGKTLRNSWTQLQNEQIFNGIEFYYIHADSKGRIWACTNRGLYVLAPSHTNFKLVHNQDTIHKTKIVATYVKELKSGKVLVSSYGNGIFEVASQNGNFTLSQALLRKEEKGDFTVVFEDRSGKLYTSKYRSGIEIYTKKEDSFSLSDFLSFTPLVYSIAESPRSGRIWIGSSQGLYWIEKKGNNLTLQKDSIFSQQFITVNGLQFDLEGQMWISTNQGLLLYDPFWEPHDTSKKLPSGHFRIFDVSDGLQETEFNFYSFTQTKKGELVFGGVNGYSIFDPQDIHSYPIPSRPSITKIELNGKIMKGNDRYKTIIYKEQQIKQLSLPPNERSLNLYFSAMEYGNPKSCKFHYYLRDMKGKYLDEGQDNFVRYFNLAPGKYLFELYASNSEGIWSEEPLRLALELKPYFVETAGFYLLLALISLGILYAIYQNQIEHIRKKQQLTELENTILRVQMNPHFIFNSLNSIRSYIWDKNIKTADTFLMDVSTLTRKILNLADKRYISLAQERELLKDYMDIEAVRFKQAFSYRFDMANELELDEILIPTMILQPFVENAIIHGFSRKKKGGKIQIHFSIKAENLFCRIKDNGVGLKSAANPSKKHESKALEITRKRLRLITEQTGKATHLDIIDLSELDENLTGTQVTLSIPLL